MANEPRVIKELTAWRCKMDPAQVFPVVLIHNVKSVVKVEITSEFIAYRGTLQP